jgi:hypothetical protein
MVHSRDPTAITFNANKLGTENRSQMQLIDSYWMEKVSSAGEAALVALTTRKTGTFIGQRPTKVSFFISFGIISVGFWPTELVR